MHLRHVQFLLQRDLDLMLMITLAQGCLQSVGRAALALSTAAVA